MSEILEGVSNRTALKEVWGLYESTLWQSRSVLSSHTHRPETYNELRQE